MKALQRKVSINALAMAMGNVDQAAALLSKRDIEIALGPVTKVVKDAVRRGGKLGAVRVRRL